jgi:hypothetical protein
MSTVKRLLVKQAGKETVGQSRRRRSQGGELTRSGKLQVGGEMGWMKDGEERETR